MGKSTNGPDWTDVATFMSALESLHCCKTGVLITAGTQGHNGSLSIKMITTFPVVPGSALVSEVVTESEWPCRDCASLAAHIYGGLYRHDFAIGHAYQQRFLNGVA